MREIPAAGLAEFLRRADFGLEFPFVVLLGAGPVDATAGGAGDGPAAERLVCYRRLRLLPGKRLVCAGEWRGRKVVVKFYFAPRKARRHWRRELAGLEALAAAGLATPARLMAWPEREGVAGLILEELAAARTLLELWRAAADAAERFACLAAVTSEIAAHHRAGLVQSDIHWSNFLFSRGRVYTIDGDAVRAGAAGRELGRPVSRENLALFLAEPEAGIDEHLPALWPLYCERRGWQPRSGEVAKLAAAIRRHRFVKAGKFIAKTGRDCTAFICRREPGRLLLADRRRLFSPAFAELLARPDDLLAAGTVLKAGNSATVVRVRTEEFDLVVKRYNIKNLRHALRRGPRPSRAWISWRNAWRLDWWGIATPKPWAMIEKRVGGGWRSTAWFISEYVPGRPASELLPELDPAGPELAAWLERFAALLRRLYELRLSHGDFKATNFWCGADGCLYLLDLDALRAWPAVITPAFRRAAARDHRRLLANWRGLPHLEAAFERILGGVK
jgi:tRNA A-37 threonylcarbamoyl transferase component Bud32